MKISQEELRAILSGRAPLLPCLEEARKVKEAHFGRRIETCAIVNAKSGRCPSDCRFCAQSSSWPTKIKVYPLLSAEELIVRAREARAQGIDRFSFVTSGISLKGDEFERLLVVIEKLRTFVPELTLCASLGSLSLSQLEELKAAGLDRYHHNLETSEEFYPRICTRQNWRERFETVRRAKKVGLSTCSGGIFGLGENDEDVLSLIKALEELEVDSVPVNFLHPIPGTPLEKAAYLRPLRALRILIALRLALEAVEIRICGGREHNLRDLQALALFAASGLMVGNYLTTRGRDLSQDREMIEDLGYFSGLL
ncbi:biotin synthase BioB [Thermosulfuriphilus sp.]